MDKETFHSISERTGYVIKSGVSRVAESLIEFTFAPAEIVVDSSCGADADVNDQALLDYYAINPELLEAIS